MKTIPRRSRLLALSVLAASTAFAQNAVQVASYLLQGNFNSQRAASPPLTPVNPSGNNRFVTDTVFGQTRTVYEVLGVATPASAQGGLTYQAAGKVPRDHYSMEFIVSMTGTGWRRIYDSTNRNYSEGLHVDPSGFINYYSGAGTVDPKGKLDNGTYYHIVLVKKPGEILIYVNAELVASRAGGTLLGAMSATANPNQMVHILLDDNNEWAPAKIALFRAYSGALTADEIRQIFASPFTSTVAVPPPGFQSSGIVNSASYASANAISPGGFFSIFGTDLADDLADWGQSFVNNVAPRRLNNVRVLVNNEESFLVFTSPGQVNALAPDSVPDGPVTVVVENRGLRSAVVSTQARRINPAVFRFNPQDSRYLASTANDGSAYIAPPNLFGTNGSLNGLAIRPARPGEYVVLYGTALGPTSPSVPAGQIPPPRDGAYPLSNTSEVRFLSATGQTLASVTPAYSGLSGFPGLHQVVFKVPELNDGEYQVVVAVAGQSSPGGAYLPVAR